MSNMTPGRWTIGLDHLRVNDADEDGWLSDGDEPYLIAIGFRSRFRTPNSTHVFWGGMLDEDWANGVDAGDVRSIPAQMGALQFPDVVLPAGADLAAGAMPELVGALVIAMESDATPFSAVRDKVHEVEGTIRGQIAHLIEHGNIDLNDPGQSIAQAASAARAALVPSVGEAIGLWLQSFSDPDNIIGVQVLAFAAVDPAVAGALPLPTLREQELTLDFNTDGVSYRVTGRVARSRAVHPGAPVALRNQASMNQLDALFVDADGAVNVMWVGGVGHWAGPVRLTNPGYAPADAAVSLHHQVDINQLDLAFVDSAGALNVMWVSGTGAWQGPMRLTGTGYLAPGTDVALVHQGSNNQLDALFVDAEGAVNVSWVGGFGGWAGPVRLTATGYAPPRARIAAGHQVSINQVDVFFVDSAGALNVMWVTGGGNWQGPMRLTGTGFAPPGAGVAVANQAGPNQLDVFVVDHAGAVNVAWVSGFGAWNGPIRLTAEGYARPGGALEAIHQASANQLDVFFVDAAGALNVLWVGGLSAWAGPMRLTGTDFAPAGAGIGVGHQVSMNQLDVMLVDNAGTVNVLWVGGLGGWAGPVRLT